MQEGTRDKDLWRRLKNGERSAFDIIYRDQINDLINYGRRFTSNIEMIEDGVHDVFVYIWSRRDTLSDTDSIKKYLLVSLRNKLIKTLGKNKKFIYGESSDSAFGSEDSIEAEMTQREDKNEKVKMLEASYHILSKRQKEAIFLKFTNEHSYEDICQIMDISYQSARNLISSGLKKLQAEIKKENRMSTNIHNKTYSSSMKEKLYIRFLLGLFLLGIFSCNSSDDLNTDPELEPYFQIFADEGLKRNIVVDYEAARIEGLLQDIPDSNIQGQCFRNEERPKKVIIDVAYWENATEVEKEFIIFHELGHCFLDRTHLDDRNPDGTCVSIMHSSPGACVFALTDKNRKDYLNELFLN